MTARNAQQGQSFSLESVKAAIGGALVGGLLLPLVLGVLLQLVTGWRLPLSSWPPIAALGAIGCGWWTPGDKPGEWPLLYYSGPGHLLTIAPTRSGKGVGSIVPNLLTAPQFSV